MEECHLCSNSNNYNAIIGNLWLVILVTIVGLLIIHNPPLRIDCNQPWVIYDVAMHDLPSTLILTIQWQFLPR